MTSTVATVRAGMSRSTRLEIADRFRSTAGYCDVPVYCIEDQFGSKFFPVDKIKPKGTVCLRTLNDYCHKDTLCDGVLKLPFRLLRETHRALWNTRDGHLQRRGYFGGPHGNHRGVRRQRSLLYQ